MNEERRPGASRLPPVRKSLGQHFLTDKRILGRIADALDLRGEETVLEIGPGRGALTEILIARAKRVVAIEYDRALAKLLAERYAGNDRVEIIARDVLEVNLGELAGGPYALVGNVPYYITTPIIFKGLTKPRPERAVYLVQREVAERIAAPPGDREYGALSVNVQALATPELLFRVSAGAFQPPPKVESAVLRIVPRTAPTIQPNEEDTFRVFVQGAFGLRRKQMRRVVRELWDLDADAAERLLSASGIEATARPETMSPEDFATVMRHHSRFVSA